jgi:pimeloyl-ACP methyl ester carboxylesterase
MVNVLIMKIKILYTALICLISISLNGQGFYKDLKKVESFDQIEYPYPVQYQLLGNGISIGYMDEGSGVETIFFIHGLGSYSKAWMKNIEELKSSYRCIAIDLPGYGRSSKGDYPGSMTFFAEVVKEFADSLGIEKAVLAGHSMGGQISIIASLKYPELVERLVLIAPAGIETFSEGEKDWFRDALSAKGVMLTPLEDIESNLGHNFYKMPRDAFFMISDRYAMTGAGEEFYWYCNIIPKCVQGMVNEPVFKDLSKISQPTLIIMGEADALIPNRYLNGGFPKDIANLGAQMIPNAEAVIIPKAGHFVSFEKASEVNAEIKRFLSEE